MEFVRVGSIAEVPEGELRAFELPTGRVAVAHLDNRIYAVGDECTHAGCSLADGELTQTEAAVVCVCHESTFDLDSGEPLSGPAQDPVPVFPVRVDDGWIEIGSRPQEGADR